jgi:chemotaxis protein methyltransferase CheR
VSPVAETILVTFSDWIAERLGLFYPHDRFADLERGLQRASPRLGYADAESFARDLLGRAPTLDEISTLAEELTIGETYFMRDRPQLEDLVQQIIREKRRYIWCAGCCTGEEAYSLAILLDRLSCGVTPSPYKILATDINPHFLRKAKTGVYGEWSFRNVPGWLRGSYCSGSPDGRYELAPRIRDMVRFETLNLVTHHYPPADVIICRNVLMYFSPLQRRRTLQRFFSALTSSGLLLVSSTESSPELTALFALERCGDSLFYRKGSILDHVVPSVPAVQRASAAAAVVALRPETVSQAPVQPRPALSPAERARRLADSGELPEALKLADEGIRQDNANAQLHYLRALILRELGRADECIAGLRRVIYLEPDFVPAHFSLGEIAAAGRSVKQARRHFGTAMSLLEKMPPEAVVEHAGSLTAGRLRELIQIASRGVSDDV